ncbi:MAG: YigZ family protein [Spirochaetes bacterium]|nr:YigZ family protein [Spirochaetota bacterium]
MDSPSFEVPAHAARADLKVSNSRFIASLDYAESLDEARAFLARIREEFPDATHHVPAFIIGGARSRTEFCSDGGEPGSTAGRPLLAVLRGSGLGNLAVVVTRYFGGTLLGTGGLVKAYSEAGRLVLERAGRGELVEVVLFSLELPYQLFEPLKRVLEECGAELLSSEFVELVQVGVGVPLSGVDGFRSRLADLGGGAIALVRRGQRKVVKPLP